MPFVADLRNRRDKGQEARNLPRFQKCCLIRFKLSYEKALCRYPILGAEATVKEGGTRRKLTHPEMLLKIRFTDAFRCRSSEPPSKKTGRSLPRNAA